MSQKLLLPNKFKIIGWCLLVPATVLGIVLTFTGFSPDWCGATVFAILNDDTFGKNEFFTFVHTDIINTLTGSVFIIGAMFTGFSKEKKEDEYIANLRLSSLLRAVWVNYILLFLAFVFVYGTSFLTIMIYNMFTVLIIFIVRFNFILYKNAKTNPYEK